MAELPEQVSRLIDLAIEEDLGEGDITSEVTLEEGATGRAAIVAREPIVCSGMDVARTVFSRIGTGTVFRALKTEGEDVAGGETMAELEGPLKVLLAGERTALNFLQRTCGVATLSRRYALLAAGRTVILDSRKTIPGWRWLDKRAVRAGGCSNHRMGLYDGILIKDNHIAACGTISTAVARAKRAAPPGTSIEVEVDDLEGLQEALAAGAEVIMLDNFTPRDVANAVEICSGRAKLEVSGGIDMGNLKAYLDAATVDYISVGGLTHSARAADIALDIVDDSGK